MHLTRNAVCSVPLLKYAKNTVPTLSFADSITWKAVQPDSAISRSAVTKHSASLLPVRKAGHHDSDHFTRRIQIQGSIHCRPPPSHTLRSFFPKSSQDGSPEDGLRSLPPFDALDGYSESIDSKNMEYIERIDLEEDDRSELNRRLQILRSLTFNSKLARASRVKVSAPIVIRILEWYV